MPTAFFDAPVQIARYDQQKYPIFEKLTRQQISYFWVPEEISLDRDAKDFRQLSAPEQHIFTSNIKRQIVLDTKQGTAPSIAFLPITSLPELETWIQTWTFFETLHSRSYTHIIRNIYPQPGAVFDSIMDIEPIVDLSKDISRHYNRLVMMNHHDYFDTATYNRSSHKKALWMALNAVNVLEGIRFYVSFACSWAFAEKKTMEGNAKMIKFICRDENIHLASVQHLLKILPKDDPEFAEIAKESEEEVIELFRSAVNQEKEWAKYLFQEGSMLGLNNEMLSQYVDWIANKRMSTLGLPALYKGGTNPLPWTQKWIGGSEVQVAPQETQISSYTVGGVKKDVDADTFKGFVL